MSTWNKPLWGPGKSQPGTIGKVPPFPELYLRQFVDDMGSLPNELAGTLKQGIDEFTIVANQTQVTLTHEPSQAFSPLVARNGDIQYPTIDYIINGRTITYPEGVLQVNDGIAVSYVY